MKEYREDGTLPGDMHFARIYEISCDGESGYNMWAGEYEDDSKWPTQKDIEKYNTFVKWETGIINYQEAEERLRVLNKTPRYEYSTLLAELGFDGSFGNLLDKVSKEDVVLGKISMSTLSVKQLNTFTSLQTGFSRNYIRMYVNDDSEVVITTEQRYRDVYDKYQLDNWAVPVALDFIFNKDRPQDRFD